MYPERTESQNTSPFHIQLATEKKRKTTRPLVYSAFDLSFAGKWEREKKKRRV
jgi:hypothetical protein